MDKQEKIGAAIDALMGQTIESVAALPGLGEIYIILANGKTVEIYTDVTGSLCMELEESNG